jgi:hypothetical protein
MSNLDQRLKLALETCIHGMGRAHFTMTSVRQAFGLTGPFNAVVKELGWASNDTRGRTPSWSWTGPTVLSKKDIKTFADRYRNYYAKSVKTSLDTQQASLDTQQETPILDALNKLISVQEQNNLLLHELIHGETS